MGRFADSFGRPDNASLGAEWTTGYPGQSSPQIVGLRVRPAGPVTPSMATWQAAIGGDQFAAITVKNWSDPTSNVITLQLRRGGTGSDDAYVLEVGSIGNYYDLYKLIAGSYSTFLNGGHTTSANDRIAVVCRGTAMHFFRNGIVIASTTSDGSRTTGSAGFHIFANASAANVEAADFLGGDVPIVIGNAGAEGSAASGNITPGTPGSLQRGDLLWCVCHSSDQVSHSMPSGWTQVVQGNGGGTTSRLSVWQCRYDGVAMPSALITHTAGQSPIAGIQAFRATQPDEIVVVDVVGTINGGTDASMEHNGITPTAEGGLLLACGGMADDNNVTALTGWSILFEDSGAGTNGAFVTTAGTPDGAVFCHARDSMNGATGTVTLTQAAADPWASVLISLKTVKYNLQQAKATMQAVNRGCRF